MRQTSLPSIQFCTIDVDKQYCSHYCNWRKRSIPTHSEWLYPLTFDAGKGLKEA